VYESIGSDFFLAVAPGCLNLGLWDGPGSEDEALAPASAGADAPRPALPSRGGDRRCGDGRRTQDPLILSNPPGPAVALTSPSACGGRDRLRQAEAVPWQAMAARLAVAEVGLDGVISVMQACSFSSQ